MKEMKDKEKVSSWIQILRSFSESKHYKKTVFLDSNIFIYSMLKKSDNNDRYNKTLRFLEQLDKHDNEIIISIQVLNEIYNVLTKKYKKPSFEVILKIEEIIEAVTVAPITLETIKKSWWLVNKYNYSYYDSLILASALENECNVLYSEDMHDGHKIDKLKIINPY